MVEHVQFKAPAELQLAKGSMVAPNSKTDSKAKLREAIALWELPVSFTQMRSGALYVSAVHIYVHTLASDTMTERINDLVGTFRKDGATIEECPGPKRMFRIALPGSKISSLPRVNTPHTPVLMSWSGAIVVMSPRMFVSVKFIKWDETVSLGNWNSAEVFTSAEQSLVENIAGSMQLDD